ncbi:hypothetical protein ASPBRDRAFT_548651 [Aspergillus brasiliensis CBS 101740]|uniref:Uncharacterized protein n=1 Tax=Aspergillus brasiliensis (strain CBS 101740 / IMI 381727 / IBT 21946) TaxID=767769 RepID=A0A1L9ULX1_ASPBC|nr:hypothetical protein ASPBRDRAFT_548651 [Aspergillus brasiliensis CBS 101740]
MVSTPGRERSQTSQTRKTDCLCGLLKKEKDRERGSAVTRQRDRNIVIGCDPPQRQRVGGARRPCWNYWLFGLERFSGTKTDDDDDDDRCAFSVSPPFLRRQFPSREYVRLFALSVVRHNHSLIWKARGPFVGGLRLIKSSKSKKI